MDKIRIILVDDHKMFRDGVKSVLSDEKNLDLVGEAGNAKELLELLKANRPDIIITDISMPDLSGIELAKIVLEKYPYIKILFLSMHTNEEFVVKAFSTGARGYLPKDAGMNELLEAINTIYNGGRHFNKAISETLLTSYISKLETENNNPDIQSLTKREKEVVDLIVDGYTNPEIADKLFISIRTVDSHKSNILSKLQLKSSVELVKYAIRNKLVSLD